MYVNIKLLATFLANILVQLNKLKYVSSDSSHKLKLQ